MESPVIKLGVVVRDRYGQTGIVLTKEATPAQDWIDDQLAADDIKSLGPTEWWGVMPFGGGYLLVPGPLLVYLRDATYEDFLTAAESARASGRERLAKIFPDYLERVVAERQRTQQ
jgi:hypothetical protein